MFKRQMTLFLAMLFVALTLGSEGFAQLPQRGSAYACESTTSKAQTNSLIDLEIVTRTEERVEALRDRLFDLQVQEMALHARLDDLDYQLTPEAIQRALAFVGSPRPMDEFREALRIMLESQEARVHRQLELLSSSRERLESAIRETEADLERLRQR